MARIGIYGWGVVAPRSRNVEAFEANLQRADSWLEPFNGFGPSTFLVGQPDFDFGDYRDWINERFLPTKYPQLQQKMGMPTQHAIGAFIQALGQNEGIEATLQELGSQTQVLVGTGLGDFPTQYDCSVVLYRAQRRWDRFWADPERNTDRRRYEEAGTSERETMRTDWEIPPEPSSGAPEDVEVAHQQWNAFWMARSADLLDFLAAFDSIENEGLKGEIAAGKLGLLRRKRTSFDNLVRQWGCPIPPWAAVPARLLWNIHNTPAAQISMLGKITGPAYAPVAACSTFGVSLYLAMQAINTGQAKAVVVGAAAPRPHATSVGCFYGARVLASASRPSMPFTDLRGTHVAGGSCIWIVGDHDFMSARGYKPLGLEILGVGVTSDADHIITPSQTGPRQAIHDAFTAAGVGAESVGTWDLHATATPGDYQEVSNLNGVLPEGVLLTARKGTFGHGMSVGGGWELMAQHMGITSGHIYPSPITDDELHPDVRRFIFNYVGNIKHCAPAGVAGKLSMGVGGINACVISRRWEDGLLGNSAGE